MSNAVLRAYEAARAPLARRPKLIAWAGAILFIIGLWVDKGFWMGMGVGFFLVSMVRILADRRA